MTATLDDPVAAAPPPSPAPREPWRQRLQPLVSARGGWAVTGLVALLGGLLRFLRLDLPEGRIFDEVYYACDAENFLRYGVEHATRNDPNNAGVAAQCIPEGTGSFIAHPPLGKWAIALGIRIFGTNEFGWRFAAAVAGTLTILIVVRVARRMTGSTLLGALAGILLSLDGLHFVQSRVAMLDIFLVLWTTAAFAALVVDRDQIRERLATDQALGWRPWRLLAGACLGAALATKWSAVYFVAALILLAFFWEVGARRTAGRHAPVRDTLRRSAVPLLAALVLLPLVLYVVSWTGWFVSDIGWDRNWAKDNPSEHFGFLPDGLRSLWHYHVEIFGFHDNLSQKHGYQSHPLGWLLLARPVSYYYPAGVTLGKFGCEVESCSREVLAVGTPAIWFATIPLVLALLWMWLGRRDWRAGAILLPIAVSILPWIRDDLKNRTMFIFYALPAVPFMALGLALVCGWALGGPGASPKRRKYGAIAVGAYLAVVVINFVYLYPILAAQTLSYDEWRSRMLFPSWI
jgi:dolichyl-phosphate-mannose--protein O-mannosyl transferase